MTGPAVHQDPEGISARAIWIVAAAVIAISAGLVAIAWLLVAPPPAPSRPPAARSPLEHGLIERADAGEAIRAAGARRLDRTEWVDRAAHVARIPIERAIDAVAADPRLIAAPPGSGSASADPPAVPIGAALTSGAVPAGEALIRARAASTAAAGSTTAGSRAALPLAPPATAGLPAEVRR